MAKNVNKIAEALGATVIGEVPETGGGAFGMSRLAAILRTRLEPGQGRRPGRPSNPLWVQARLVLTMEVYRSASMGKSAVPG